MLDAVLGLASENAPARLLESAAGAPTVAHRPNDRSYHPRRNLVLHKAELPEQPVRPVPWEKSDLPTVKAPAEKSATAVDCLFGEPLACSSLPVHLDSELESVCVVGLVVSADHVPDLPARATSICQDVLGRLKVLQ